MNLRTRIRKSFQFLLSFTIVLSATTISSAEGDEGFIYGTITMDNGSTYQGVIRWGDEEAFWDDMFNSTKTENVFDDYLWDIKDIEDLEDEIYSQHHRRKRVYIWNREFWEDRWDEDYIHQFKCRFGDIRKMKLRGRESVLLTFKDGTQMKIKGGSNDIGANLQVFDGEIGIVELKWRRIRTVEFMPTPKKLENKFGEPLYGEVETRRGSFKGFIQWDHDECLSTDVLDGDSEDGDVEIEFEHIRSIEKYRRGSLVTLKSGRELYLTGSNDVNSENRGVVVKDPHLGKVLVGWREFEKITFEDVNDSGLAYDDFTSLKMLSGFVKTRDDKTYSGRIIYDLDEVYDLEILDGEDGRVEYLIPFRNIKRILPEQRYGSTVELRNGEELKLEDAQDIDEKNDGIVVWDKKDEVKYIPWRRVKEVVFD